MAVDTPATIAILGAGPIGLEAALYARFLGYDVIIYEQGLVAQTLRQHAALPLLWPFGEGHSSLGRNALRAQDENIVLPAHDAELSHQGWIDSYLQPLADSDLLADHLRLQTKVLGISRAGILKHDSLAPEERSETPFRIVWQTNHGEEGEDQAEIVIDATGVEPRPAVGAGGLFALGEMAAQNDGVIERGWIDLSRQQADYAGKQILVLGGGLLAATNVVALARLAEQHPQTSITWSIRREGPAAGGALQPHPAERSSARGALIAEANRLIMNQHPAVRFLPATQLQRLTPHPHGGWEAEFHGEVPQRIPCQRIVANVGQQPNLQLVRELQIAWDPVTERALPPADDSTGLVTREPNFYLLGRKSWGRTSGFTFVDGLRQIRDLFALIGDRKTLDLYASNERLG